jgi:hypothetical protein
MSPRRNLKPREDGTSGRTEQSGYQFKKYRTPLAKLSSKTIYAPVDQQEEKSIDQYAQGVEENNKRQEKPAIIPNTTRDKTNIYSVL